MQISKNNIRKISSGRQQPAEKKSINQTMTSLPIAGFPAAQNSLPGPQKFTKSHLCHPSSSFLVTHFRNKSRRITGSTSLKCASSSSSSSGPVTSPGLYSAKVLDLTAENVNVVLDDVRPYLIADGGNVDVVSVQDGVISLKLQGACGSCPSSTTTMKMGIERVLKEKFGAAVKDICQVTDELQNIATTVEAVNDHLNVLRPAIKNYGGTVEVTSVQGGDCHVKYVGPDSIGTGIRAAIKEKFPDIVNVVLTS